ncbi:GIY-YIG nuclease family protein [Thalassotalea fonticola]|uniref:GIY-YIG nuclease family protein n=1 Tax=Thalassotalea fonticola TaxID=3065649 RepID=A0ABZ0GJM7_9GAMM|nr:GIY-YIG nuclease family protein [Colwelliaceae bacterium S1-1]
MTNAWFVYLVRCADDSLYCGISTDVERRVGEHNSASIKSAKYTRNRLPVTLVYFEECDDRSHASKREWAIKQLTRKKKLELITAG